MFNTAILLIVFNRIEPTQKVFDSIKVLKPKKLYIAADGPRSNNKSDQDNCAKVREIVSKIDWDCTQKTLFRDENLGCGLGVSSAINWLFENETEGIILEDDCVPALDFYPFCAELLKLYRNTSSVTSIAGSNFQDGKIRDNESYYFSAHNRIWGWATWKRVWDKYDYYLNNLDFEDLNMLFDYYHFSSLQKKYWNNIFEHVKRIEESNHYTWDYQFMFLQWKLNGLTIIPNSNLVSNIGYGTDATHTIWEKSNPLFNRKTKSIFPLIHNHNISQNLIADKYYFDKYIYRKPNYYRKMTSYISKIINRI